jgi:thiol-disulfide isomerase/thioredoxin
MKQKNSVPGKVYAFGNVWREYKYVIMVLLAALIVLLTNVLSYAQGGGVKVGEVVPDVRVGNVVNYKSKAFRMSDFRGKVLILDFWASWCSPCVAMIPRMDSLQREFGDKVVLMPVNDQDPGMVLGFLEKLKKLRPFELPDVLGDTVLNRLFPHSYLPHFVWVGVDGKVMAITEFGEVNERNIRRVLAGEQVSFPLKSDHLLAGDQEHLRGVVLDTAVAVYHRLVPGYEDDLPAKWENWPEDSKGKRIFCSNLAMPDLFALALGEGVEAFPRNRRVYEVKDTSDFILDVSGEEAIEWAKLGKHATGYEVRVPPGMGKLAFEIMLGDLRQYFTDYDVRVDRRPVKCLALVRTDSVDRLRSKGGKSLSEFDGISAKLVNFPLVRLVAELSAEFMCRSPYPIVDETGYKPWVDLEINARLSDVKAVNKELAKYGLALELREEPLDMMVIRDHLKPLNHEN